MLPSFTRTISRNLVICRLLPSISTFSQRNYASEWDADDWGFYYPDPRSYANETEIRRWNRRVQGVEKYVPRILYRDEINSEFAPNVIPTFGDERIFGCICETDVNYVVWHKAKKGELGRCECGFWFKIVDADYEMDGE